MFLLQCCQHLTFSSVYNHQASFLCWAEAIFVGNVMPSTWGLLHNRTNQLSVAFSEHLSLRVFPVGMFLTTVAVYLDVSFFCHENTFTVVVTYIFARSFLPVRCRCRGLLLCLITLNDTLTHKHTHTHSPYHSGRGICPSQRPLPVQHTVFTRDKHPCPWQDSNTIPASEPPQTYELDPAATGFGFIVQYFR